MHVDKLDYITNKYNNTYHSTIKIKPSSSKESNNKDSKFKIGDIVRISKYKNIFAKDYVPNWSEEIFLITKIKNTALWTYAINDLKGEGIIGTFGLIKKT